MSRKLNGAEGKIPYPALYQINTRVWLTELASSLGRPATLDDIPEAELERFKKLGLDWLWFWSVWQTGKAGQKVARENQQWRHDFQKTLSDLRESDILGSGFAITGYTVSSALGGDAALARLWKRLKKHGLKLMLDFVPNHMGLDHPWLETHPEYFVAGTQQDLERDPRNYTLIKRARGELILAYGRDPHFFGWPDTLQLDYSQPAVQEAMLRELQKIAGQCDGVRCDMAMLISPEVFERTWGRRAPLFWPRAIKKVREQYPDFCFMAEVYWDLGWTLQQEGFDFTYDKRLYDRLRDGQANPVRDHLGAGLDYQNKLMRFLENHDELPAAVTFDPKVHEAAAITTFLLPGLRFFHQGQFEGRKIHVSPHLIRAPVEPCDENLKIFYDKLLGLLRMPLLRRGRWRLLECVPAGGGYGIWDSILAYSWESDTGQQLLVAVNYASHQSQCYIRLPFSELAWQKGQFIDLMDEATYNFNGEDLFSRGLYVDLAPWGYHVLQKK